MKYDLAIMMQTSDQELPPGSISLFEEDFMLAVPNGHPFTQKLYVNLEDLKNERFAMFQKTSAYRIAITRFCAITYGQTSVSLLSRNTPGSPAWKESR